MTQAELATLIIAIVSVAIASISLAFSIVLGVFEIRRHQQKVKVKVNLGFMGFRDGETSEPFIIADAINNGKGDNKITSFGFLQKDGSRQIIINPYLLELPYPLAERRKCTGYYAVRWFQENDKAKDIVGVFFGDEIGNTWKTKITRKMRRDWLDWDIEGVRIEWSQNLRTYYREDMANGEIDFSDSDDS